MSRFLLAAKRAIDSHGRSATYTSVTEGAYNIETSATTNTEAAHTVTLFRKRINVNQYNYPNLINRDVSEFYLCNDSLSFTPAIRDFITYDSTIYIVDSIRPYEALGDIVLYKIVAYKG